MELYSYTKICDDVWQIAEDDGVYCTLIMGTRLALLIDTGYGRRNLKSFVNTLISTPRMVINSHGHPDHIGGNHWFDCIYALRDVWSVIRYFEADMKLDYELKEVQIGQRISLGNMEVDIVSLAGHTKGSIGFLLREKRLLIAGDALNEGLWLFNYGSLSMKELYISIMKTMERDFEWYLCGHSNRLYEKRKLYSHLKNIDNLKIDDTTKQIIMGFETYRSSYEDENGKSEITFTLDKI